MIPYNTDIQGQRVLVTDDNPDELLAMSRILSRCGFKVENAQSGSDTLVTLSAFKPDIVILDIFMPEPDGFEVCRQIKELPGHEYTPVVLVSSAANTADIWHKSREAGADDFIARPVPADELVWRITQVLQLRHMKKNLKQAQSNWEALFEAIDQPTLITDAAHTVQDINEMGVKQLGLDRQSIIGKKCHDIMHDLEKPVKNCPLIESMISRKTESKAIELEKLKGEYLVSCTPVLDADNNIEKIIHISTDISELKQIEHDRQELEDHLRHSQKLEAIGTLAGGIAHDFNNILTSIIGFAELSFADAKNNTVLSDNLNEIFVAGKRAKELVKQILTFARQTKEQKQHLEIGPIVKEVIKLLRSSVPTSIDIACQITTNASVKADPTRIHQVLLNLCTNAVQAMEDKGGKLDVILKPVEHGTENLIVPMADAGDTYIELSVCDTGTGIPKELQKKIFDPYFTTKDAQEGTGLGLSTVHGIVQDCEGYILCNSKPGKGSRFTIYLPVSKHQHHSVEPRTGLPKGNERILLVDDEPAIAKLGAKMLTPLGYTVHAETDSMSALSRFKSDPDGYDLVITDMTMPKITGDLLAVELKKIKPDIPVILCTGYSKKVTPDKIHTMDVNAILVKPIPHRELAKSVRKLLDHPKP